MVQYPFNDVNGLNIIERMRNPVRQAFSYGIQHVFILIQWTVTHSLLKILPYGIPHHRAVASLTVPGWQEFHFPHFVLKFDKFFFFPLKFDLFSPHFVGDSPTQEPGKALAASLPHHFYYLRPMSIGFVVLQFYLCKLLLHKMNFLQPVTAE